MFNPHRNSYLLLCISPFLLALVGSLRPILQVPLVHYGAALILALAICVAGWGLGAGAIRMEGEVRRGLAAAGGLLLATWAILPIIAAMGPPEAATAGENKIRYVLLSVAAITLAGGFVMLKEALSRAGEHFYSTLGFTSILLAGPLYLVFTAIQHLEYRTLERTGALEAPVELMVLDSLSLILLLFGAILTYLAAAAFAAALEKTQLLGRRASRIYVGMNLFFLLCMAIRLVEALILPGGPIFGFAHWYSLPGFILSIPAVPWIIPCMLGIVLLRRSGEDPTSIP